MTNPHNILRFPKEFKRRQEAIEVHRISCANLLDQLKRIDEGLAAGMTAAEVRDEWEARRCEEVIEHWAKRMAAHPRRGSEQSASFLHALAGRLLGGVES